MHEYSLMQQIIEAIKRQVIDPGQATPPTVRIVHLTVGALDIHSEASFRQAFEVLIRETPLAGAVLEMTIVPAHYTCQCGHQGQCGDGEVDVHQSAPYLECPICGAVCPLEGGRGVMDLKLTVVDEKE
jgi:Zn finger protein HypA/HybF involved in hydrogenase expression